MARIETLAALALVLAAGQSAWAADVAKSLAEEQTSVVASLPAKYPDGWIVVQDLHFNSLPDGRAVVIDVTATDRQYKGQIQVGQLGNVLLSAKNSEIYVSETYYSRLSRGDRSDVITIWDNATLAPKGEIILPDGKRGQFVTLRNSFQLLNEDKWALVFNFTPASSVTVVDLGQRKVLTNIDLPGCSLIYPTGARGFSSLCADGTMMSVTLGPDGKAATPVVTKAFNNIDADPLFMTPAMVGSTGWFVSFRGNFRAIDFSGSAARNLGGFGLPPQTGADPEWRPSGWQVVSADRNGLLYVLMNPKSREGTHKDGGTEIWVVDPKAKALVRRIALKHPGLSVEATQQASPLIVASRTDGSLDVYDATSGQFVRSILDVAHDPMTMTAVR
jgi:methylamine dehydrogenase heavy chain